MTENYVLENGKLMFDAHAVVQGKREIKAGTKEAKSLVTDEMKTRIKKLKGEK